MRLTDRLAEQIGDRREQLMGRAQEGGEQLMRRAQDSREELMRRAQMIREQFGDNVSTEMVTGFAGWALVSSGIAWGVTDWVRGRRSLRSLLLPMALIVMGSAVLSGGMLWRRRSSNIDEAEARVREQIEALDPFARFRVLRDVAGETVPFVKRISVRGR